MIIDPKEVERRRIINRDAQRKRRQLLQKTRRRQIQVFLEFDQLEALEALAVSKGLTKADLLALIVQWYLEGRTQLDRL